MKKSLIVLLGILLFINLVNGFELKVVKEITYYPNCDVYNVVFSGNSLNIGAVVGRPQSVSVWLNGNELTKDFTEINRIKISGDGLTVAYIALEDAKYLVGFNSQYLNERFDYINQFYLLLNGKSALFVGFKEGFYAIYRNDKKLTKDYTSIEHMVLSPDYSTILYSGDVQSKQHLFIDDIPQSVEGYDKFLTARFDNYGQSIIYSGLDKDGLDIFKDDTILLENLEGARDPIIREKDNLIIYIKDKFGISSLWMNKKKIFSGHHDISDIMVSKDLKSIIYLAKDNEKYSVMLNDTIVAGNFDQVEHLQYSERRNVIYFTGYRNGGWGVYKNGNKLIPNLKSGVSYLGHRDGTGDLFYITDDELDPGRKVLYMNDRKITSSFDRIFVNKKSINTNPGFIFAGFLRDKHKLVIYCVE